MFILFLCFLLCDYDTQLIVYFLQQETAEIRRIRNEKTTGYVQYDDIFEWSMRNR